MFSNGVMNTLRSAASARMVGPNYRLRKFDFEAENPTATLYFTQCMQSLIGEIGNKEFPVWEISPTVFYVWGDNPKTVVLRGWSEYAREKVASLPSAPIHYLIDDDIAAGIEDGGLHFAYRQRLAKFDRDILGPMLSSAKCVYVPSKVLATRLERSNENISVVKPTLLHPVADQLHHQNAKRLKLIFSGTRSHLASLKEIASPLRKLLQDRPDLHLTTYLGKWAPRELILENVEHKKSLSWPEYKNVLASDRYHVALMPCRSSRFDEARSHCKVLECGMYGAAPLYGIRQPYASLLTDAGIGCSYEPGSMNFVAAFEKLTSDRQFLQDVAASNTAFARRLGSPDSMRKFWLQELEIT